MNYNIAPRCQIKNLNKIYLDHFGFRNEGHFVEVGAFDGITWSNTSCLAFAGWNGLLIEPNPRYYKMCRSLYTKYPKVKFCKSAVGSFQGETKLYLGDSISTIKEDMVEVYQNLDWSKQVRMDKNRYIDVNIDTLNNILNENQIPNEFDLLVIDVEGAEYEVIKGLDLSKWKPKMMIIEMHEKHPDKILSKDSHKIHELLKNQYKVVQTDAINTIFIRNDFSIDTNM